MSELDLQKFTVALLRYQARRDVLYLAIPNGEARSPRTGAKLKAMGVLAGAADLLIVVGGIAHWLELKTGKGRQSPAQKVFQAQAEDAGSRYMVARSPEAVRNILAIWQAIPADSASLRRAVAA